MDELVDEEVKQSSEDKNDGFFGDVQPWDALPGSSAAPFIPDFTNAEDSNASMDGIPHQPVGIGGTGSINNYNGPSAVTNTFNNPSGAPGAGNAAAPVDSTGYVQL